MGRIKRVLAGGTVLFVLAATVAVIGGATADAATFSSDTASGPAGSTVRVSGQGYLTPSAVDLCWNEPGCDDLGSAPVQPGLVLLGLPLTYDFAEDVIIPEDATPGFYRIYGCQLLDCAWASFEVIASEEPTTTTTSTLLPPSTTTTMAVTTTVSPTTTNQPEEEPQGPPQADQESAGPAVPRTTRPPATPVVAPTTEEPEGPTTTQAVRSYTPPTVESTEESPPDPEPEVPTVVLGASDEEPSALSWLDDPLLFWASWLVAVVVGGLLASMIGWLIRRQRREG